jgi:hypothetical protein
MDFNSLLECTSIPYWNAISFLIGMNIDSLLECISIPYWNGLQFLIGMDFNSLLECTSIPYWNEHPFLIGMHIDSLLECTSIPYWNARPFLIGRQPHSALPPTPKPLLELILNPYWIARPILHPIHGVLQSKTPEAGLRPAPNPYRTAPPILTELTRQSLLDCPANPYWIEPPILTGLRDQSFIPSMEFCKAKLPKQGSALRPILTGLLRQSLLDCPVNPCWDARSVSLCAFVVARWWRSAVKQQTL